MAQAKQFPKLPAKQFAVALCSKNVWGVIFSDGKQEIEFEDGSVSECYTGFACRGTVIAGWGHKTGETIIKKEGDLWASRDPHVVAYLEGINPDQPIEDILMLARHRLSALNL